MNYLIVSQHATLTFKTVINERENIALRFVVRYEKWNMESVYYLFIISILNLTLAQRCQ